MARNRRPFVSIIAVLVGLVLSGCASGPKPADNPPVASIGAMGDSISRAFDACTFLADCMADSWTTGNDPAVASHYQRLLARNPAIAGRAYNVAKVGASSADLPDEAKALAARRPDYITMLMGSNDACAEDETEMTSPAVFRARVDQALTTIYTARPDTRMLVASIPDIYRLWQVGHSNSVAQLVWSAGFCRTMLDNPTSTSAPDEARRQRVRTRVMSFNDQLAAACALHPGCRYDGGAVFAYPFAVTDLSRFDFFHPNAAGQRKLSAITWAKSGL
ncbi:MAG TPA: GDSL-type esterase/lipase family protein [Frankiaceae bacterium]|nr:GDSL-type esterase/lipase family protein [Frankiaceae bacterium]